MITLDDQLRRQLATNLASHDVRTHPLDGRRHAAVAVVVVDSDPVGDEHASFLLCRRAARLNSHSQQWALPGGRLDEGESAEVAALRELEEELGLRLPDSAVLGRLDDYPTRSGYVITPVVVWGGRGVELVPAPDEVAHVYRIGLHELCRDDSPRYINIPESDRPVVQIPLGDSLVHAPTGAVLLQFRWVAIEGRLGHRVDDLEQPVFAWR